MNTKSLALLGLLILGLCGLVRAGSILDLDHAEFRAGDSLAYVEIYAAIQRSNLIYVPNADTLTAEFDLVLEIFQSDTVALSDTLHAVDVRDTSAVEGASGQFFVHVFRFVMLPGGYGLRASLYQFDTEPRDVVNENVQISAYDGSTLQLSGVELGTKLEFTEENTPLVKNGVRIVPNPTRFFGSQLPLFYYYAEAYGLAFDSVAADSHEVVRRIIDAETGSAVRPEVVKAYPTRGSSVVIADGFPVATLRTGTYYLELEIRSARAEQQQIARKKFWIYRKDDFIAGRSLQPNPEFQARLAEVEPGFLEIVDADSALQWMKYLLTRDENSRISRLNAQGKREFLRNYWVDREKADPGATNRYFARVIESNNRYTFLKRPGWKTDRGRVFIQNGTPDHVTQNYATAGIPDHEVWEYEQLEGGVTFVFFDRTGFGDLDLVHSTKRGEVYNPNWHELAPATHGRPGN